MILSKKKILITGASGVVGRAVLAGLPSEFEVITVGRNSKSDLIIDLAGSVIDLLSRLDKPDCVIHLAAMVPNNDDISDNIKTENINEIIDNNIYEICKIWDCHVIYASGCSLYEENGSHFVYEEDPFYKKPQSFYLNAKKAGDVKFSRLSKSCILRISFPVGIGLSFSTVIGKFLMQLENDNAINVYGTGSREQDFIDVRDISSIVNLVLKRNTSGAFNIARGYPTKMQELAELMVVIKGKGEVITGRKKDPLEGAYARYSVGKAHAKLGWKPNYNLKEMLVFHGLL